MTFEETLHILQSWAGRNVVAILTPDGTHRCSANLSGRLRPREDVSVAEEDRPVGSSYFFALTEDRFPTGFYLDKDEFTDALLKDRGGALVIQLRGAELIVEAAKRVYLR